MWKDGEITRCAHSLLYPLCQYPAGTSKNCCIVIVHIYTEQEHQIVHYGSSKPVGVNCNSEMCSCITQ